MQAANSFAYIRSNTDYINYRGYELTFYILIRYHYFFRFDISKVTESLFNIFFCLLSQLKLKYSYYENKSYYASFHLTIDKTRDFIKKDWFEQYRGENVLSMTGKIRL